MQFCTTTREIKKNSRVQISGEILVQISKTGKRKYSILHISPKLNLPKRKFFSSLNDLLNEFEKANPDKLVSL